MQLTDLNPSLQITKKMSRHYQEMDTQKMVETMLALTSKGQPVFELRSIQARKSKKGALRGVHIVRLRTVEPYILNGETLYPELVIHNSYDGSCPLKVDMGVFRLVCTNGLVIKSHDLGAIRIRHMGTPQEVAMDAVKQFASQLPQFIQAQEQLVNTILTDEEMVEFAMLAAECRWNAKFTEEDARKLLEASRPEDEGDNLWLVFNRVQEKLMNGGYKLSGQKRNSRPILNGVADVALNTALFELATEFVTANGSRLCDGGVSRHKCSTHN